MPTNKTAQVLTMPCNEQAEQSVLGAMLIEPAAVEKATSLLTESDFYVDKHKTLFRVISEMTDDGVPTDEVTLVDRVAKDSRAPDFGGTSYILSLFDAVPTAANVDYYCGIVREKAQLRSLLMTGLEATARAQGPVDNVQELVEDIHRKLFSIITQSTGSAFSSLSEAIMEVHDEIEARADSPIDTIGLSTGFEEIDALLGGLEKGGYYIIAGRPSIGKTACTLKIALNVAKSGHTVGIYSGEMPKHKLALRMICEQAEVSSHALLMGRAKKDDYQRAVEAAGQLYKLPLRILDNPSTTVGGLATSCRQMKAEGGLDLLVVDYVGLLQTKKNWGSRREEVGEISRLLKKLAMDLDIPILVLSQLSRAVQGRENKRPVMSDLRESGDLEQDADAVCFVHRDAYYGTKDTYLLNEDGSPAIENAEFIIEKNRNGPVGTAQIGFIQKWAKFCDRPLMEGPTGF